MTSLPVLAKHTPDTSPTYPVPTMVNFIADSVTSARSGPSLAAEGCIGPARAVPWQTIGKATARRKTSRGSRCTAATADAHTHYPLAVQNVEAEIDFVDDTFRELRGRRAKRLREDFCGTAATSCEWVRRRPSNTAVGLDIDRDTLDWGLEHNIGSPSPAQQKRATLPER